ncbi:MAG: YcaQ family DNA glycosylase [Verrucomicrobia bacterium]|nr:YcaQ family DNA glycosylase [Verrucomicrobiota bacterium]
MVAGAGGHTLSLAEARRAVLRAQGFGARPSGGLTRRHLVAASRRIGMLQIDSVNVLMRAHYFPLYSRLGAYPLKLLDEVSYSPKRRQFFEYWGHEACLLPLEVFPLLRWRMERARNFVGTWAMLARFAKANRAFIERVFAVIDEHGPASAGEIARRLLEERPTGTRGWWGWTQSKAALEFLFWCGRITTATRRNFTRVYDLVDRVIPLEILNAPTPSCEEAQRRLIAIAGRALGVATETDLRDYFRLPMAEARGRIAELVETGELVPIAVESWKAYLHRDAKIPRRVDARALISPFDSLIWERRRPERLFGFRYRIEIYTPAHKREHGYYVLPFLLRDRLVARVDLKADRQQGQLLVLSALAEPNVDRLKAAGALADELALLARWVGLEQIAVADRGNLAAPLKSALSNAERTEPFGADKDFRLEEA